jgi:hypothetical protein
MQLYTFDGILPLLLKSFHTGFTFFCIGCLTVRLFASAKLKNEAVNIQSATNLAAAIGVIIDMLSWGTLFYYAYQEQTNYEWFLFGSSVYSSKIFIVSTLSFWLIGLLFFVPKFRRNWVLSFLGLVIANLGYLASFILRFWKDYLPSEWELDENNWVFILLQLLFFSLISFLLYLLLARRKKLPYPSIWLR